MTLLSESKKIDYLMMKGELVLREDRVLSEVEVFSSAKLNIPGQVPYSPNSIIGKTLGPGFTFLKAFENTAPFSIFPFAKRLNFFNPGQAGGIDDMEFYFNM